MDEVKVVENVVEVTRNFNQMIDSLFTDAWTCGQKGKNFQYFYLFGVQVIVSRS